MGKLQFSRTIAIASGVVLTACTLITGVGDLNTSSDALDGSVTPPSTSEGSVDPIDANVVDVGADSNVIGTIDAAIVDGCSGTSCELLPSEFHLVALGATNATCPTGFAEPFDGVEQPTIDPGACTCGCNVTNQPTCTLAAGNTITLLYGPAGGGTCPTSGQDVPSGCSTAGFHGPFIAYERRYVAPAATRTGGTCAASATKDNTKLKTQSVRVCQAAVVPQCEGKTCAPDVTPFESCIAANGARDCPAAWPQRHLVGASASFTCGAGCTCSVQGLCGSAGTLNYFASTNCSGAAGLSYPVNDACNATGASNTVYGSHRYNPAGPTNVSCQNGGTSSPSAPALAQELTVCCK